MSTSSNEAANAATTTTTSSDNSKAPISFAVGVGSKRVGGSSGFTMAAPARKRQAVVKAAISSNASSLFGVDDDEEDGTAQSSSTEQQPMVRPRIKTYTAPKRNINSAASSSASLDEAQPDQPSQQQQQQQQQEYSSASVVLPEDLYEFARSIEPKLVRTMDLLAEFVTDNGIEYETLVRDRNKGDPRFRFLVELDSREGRYFLKKKQELLVERRNRSSQQRQEVSTLDLMHSFERSLSEARALKSGSSKTSGGGAKSGHHIGDFLPNKDEVDKAFSKRLAAQLSGEPLDDDAEPAAAAVTATGPAVVLPASSKGHKLMSKMGWTAGSSLGSKGDGIVAPIAAGNVKLNTLGIGAESKPGETDDIYELYKHRMMTAYRNRPNPLNNPRHQYY